MLRVRDKRGRFVKSPRPNIELQFCRRENCPTMAIMGTRKGLIGLFYRPFIAITILIFGKYPRSKVKKQIPIRDLNTIINQNPLRQTAVERIDEHET